MSFLRIHRRAILIAAIFTVVVLGISVVTQISLERWRRDVIHSNMTLTKVVAEQLHTDSHYLVDSLLAAGLLNTSSLPTETVNRFDQRLKLLSGSVLSRVEGMEGGFFLPNLDEFYGYSYPTSPPPVPVYGPPPRSYTFIKDQVTRTIAAGESIVELHQFDPAIFPLATVPLKHNDTVVAVVWTRIHVERELPAIKLREVVNVGALISLLGFAIALLVSILQRRKIQVMSQDLAEVTSGRAVQITEGKGTLGVIARSINAMVRTMREENARRKQIERQLHQKDKMASLGKVIAGVAHEVKTPLAVIKTRIQMWQQALDNSGHAVADNDVFSRESLQMVVDEVDRLTDLVRRLLLFSKPQPAVVEPTDINELVKYTVAFVQERGRPKNISISCEYDEQLPAVRIDRNGMRQVLMNILVNSIEASSENGDIEVSTAYHSDRNVCSITVRDNGVGIPREMADIVFDPFVTTKKKGFGLGLSISYEIVAARGGTIQLYPNATVGTTCVVELPINREG